MNMNGQVFFDGSRRWMVDGQYHRLDGPAVIYPNGYQVGYQNGKRHRIDGPALIEADGTHAWHIDGVQITNEVNLWIKVNKIPIWEDWIDADKLFFRMKFQ